MAEGSRSWTGIPLGVCLLCCGCDDSKAEQERTARALEAEAVRLAGILERAAPPAGQSGNALVIRLQFNPDVDLDLYVTDPLQETVYFANHHSETGGRLTEDVRCSTPPGATGAARLEEVVFTQPYAGRYRVGVDLPERCDDQHGPAAFAVAVHGAGIRRSVEGVVTPAQFEPVVLEFDLEGL